MKNQNLRSGIQVLNKLNKKMYETSVISAAESTSGKEEVLLVEILDENSTETADVITLTDENAICFRFVNDPNPAATPSGYTVENGVLKVNGDVATVQGELEFEELFATVQGGVLLISKEKEGKKNLLLYDVTRDVFKTLMANVGQLNKTSLSENRLLISQVVTTEETVYDSETGEIITDSEGKDKTVDRVDDISVRIYDMESQGITDRLHLIGTPDRITEISSDSGCRLVIESDKTITYEDNIQDSIPVLEEQTNVHVTTVDFGADLVTFANSSVKNIVIPDIIRSVTVDLDGNTVIKTDGYMYYENQGHNPRSISNKLVAELAGYDYLVKTDIRNSIETYTFANKAYEIKTIVRKRTRDRGDIITIE